MNTYSFKVPKGLLVALGLIFPLAAVAQVNDRATSVETNLVVVDVLVLDKTSKPVTNLRAEQFELYVDETRQKVDTFSTGAQPISYGVVFDMHPTTEDRAKTLINALRSLIEHFQPNDDIFLIAFGKNGEQTFDFIPALDQLERHMAEPDRRDVTSLYDAVFLASNKIQVCRNSKRVLLVISDTADHNSLHRFKELQGKIAAINSPVYALIVEGDDFGFEDVTRGGRRVHPFTVDASPFDRAAMLELTLKSGGAAYYDGVKTSYQLNKIFEDIGTEVRSQYALGFYPDSVDGSRHKIKVRLKDVPNSKDLVLIYRMIYQAASKKAP